MNNYNCFGFGNSLIIFVEEKTSESYSHMYSVEDFQDLIEVEHSNNEWFAIYVLEDSFNVITTSTFDNAQEALNSLYKKLEQNNLLKDLYNKVAKNKTNSAMELMKSA